MRKFSIFQIFILFLLSLEITSCNYFQKDEPAQAVARVGDTYLYREDVESLLPDEYTKEDSLRIVSSYINNWATKELLMLNAQRNISQEKEKEFLKLVDNYKKDLYGKYYKEKILEKSVDTTITIEEQVYFFEQNKEVFKLNEDLVKLRYIYVKGESQNKKDIETKFKRFDYNDRVELDSLYLYFTSSYLNDSTWVKANNVYQKLPFLGEQNIKAGEYVKHEDSTGVYLVKINDYLARTKQAPIEYVTPILKQIILNQRKLENAKKFEKELIQSAIKKKQFEIYE